MAKEQSAPVSLTQDSTFKRLPSFKSPRDLKLSQFANPLGESRTKKVFVPNLNVQRKKQNEDSNAGPSVERPERGRREQRGRTRDKKAFIQNAGVFSEGLAPSLKSRGSGGYERYGSGGGGRGGGGGSIGALVKPKLNLSELGKVDRAEEELIMKELMRDDFIDDPDINPDLGFSPVALPMTKFENLKLESPKEETVEKQPPEGFTPNGFKIKKEPGVMAPPEEPPLTGDKPVSVTDLQPLSTAQIIAQAQKSDFIFFQIPNSIPRLKVPETAHSKTSKNKTLSQKDGENGEGEERRTLRSLPSGRIGTLQMLRSGKARLLLGDVKLEVEPGTQVAFKQELVSVDVNKDSKTGNMIHLGNLTTRMLLMPDWESLLSSSK